MRRQFLLQDVIWEWHLAWNHSFWRRLPRTSHRFLPTTHGNSPSWALSHILPCEHDLHWGNFLFLLYRKSSFMLERLPDYCCDHLRELIPRNMTSGGLHNHWRRRSPLPLWFLHVRVYGRSPSAYHYDFSLNFHRQCQFDGSPFVLMHFPSSLPENQPVWPAWLNTQVTWSP